MPALLMLLMAQVAAAPPPAVYCEAQSDSPRGQGLIISPVFEPRLPTSLPWLRQAFTGFLNASYAPYGNTWVVRPDSALCASFVDRATAERARGTRLLVEQRKGSAIYPVTFVGP